MINCVLMGMHALTLRLYPKRFRLEFGEELRETFACLLDEAGTHGAVLRVCWHEAYQYPRSVMRAYQHTLARHWQQASEKELATVRWMTRGLSLFVLWFLVTVAWQGVTKDVSPQAVPLVLMSAITAVCISIAWWREHIGGWLTMHTSLSMGVVLFIVATSQQGSEYVANYFLAYFLYIVPSFITGSLFMSLSKAERNPRSLA